MRYFQYVAGPGNTDWYYASAHLQSLEKESRENQRISVHSDILNDRHSSGIISQSLAAEDFMAADFFLFLTSKFLRQEDGLEWWYPHSIVHMKHTPQFIMYAAKNHFAEKLAKIFKSSSVGELKILFEEMYPEFQKLVQRGFWRNPINKSDIDKIGTA
ncbi:MAG: hypothetical protein A2Z52_01780 [Candidatus Moranbacteria bacterium RBG_19FT_COMBO_42_6]|nr:MAG: hypothetical protein A2Z52_01780 [Candidatus Moranbacteria bacterium RBG_19FT_COMBO_42_6]